MKCDEAHQTMFNSIIALLAAPKPIPNIRSLWMGRPNDELILIIDQKMANRANGPTMWNPKPKLITAFLSNLSMQHDHYGNSDALKFMQLLISTQHCRVHNKGKI
jgi:hypothetical protein